MRPTTLTLCLALTLLTLPALAQPGPSLAPTGFEVMGRWEGFTSQGDFLFVDIIGLPDGTFQSTADIYEGGLVGTPVSQTNTFHVEASATPGHERFLVATTGPIEAIWYGPDALRLHFPDGLVAVIARVTRPDAATRRPLAAAPPGPTLTPVQRALLYILAGTWTGRPLDDPTISGTGVPMTFEFTIEDDNLGLLTGVMAFESDRETEHLQVVGGREQNLQIRSRDSDEVATFKFINENEIEILFEGEPAIRLVRDPH